MIELAYIVPDVEGGVASVVYNLITHTPHKQFSNTIILLETGKTNPFTRELPNTKVLRIKFDKKDSLFIKCRKLSKIIPEKAIIVSNDGGVELDTVNLLKLQNPVVYIVHGDFNYYYQIIKNKHQFIDAFISVSKHIATETNLILEKYGSPKQVKPIHFPVPNIDVTQITFVKPIKIIFIGSLIKRKGVHFFPEFIEQLSKSNISFEFNIIGEGELVNIITEIAQKYKEVHYLGTKTHKEVLSLLKEHHILFLPSLSEGLPVTIIEAMKTGLVTITSDIKSGIPEIINENTGYMIKPGNITEYVNAVKELYLNPKHFSELKSNAIALVNNSFNPEIQTSKYLNKFANTIYDEQKHSDSSQFKSLVTRLPDKFRLFLTNRLFSTK